MHHFKNGTYRGHRYSGPAQAPELYGEYKIEVVEPAKDGTPRIRVNGGRAKKVFAHSHGLHVEAACLAYAPNYTEKRYPLDEIKISADPQFFVGE